MMTFHAPGHSAAFSGAAAEEAGAAELRRIMAALEQSGPSDVLVQQLLSLARRWEPRRPDGTVDASELGAMVRSLDSAMAARRVALSGGGGPGGGGSGGGATATMIEELPTREFSSAHLPSAAGRSSEHTQCMVCLCDYVDGDTLRTLPCLHSFHAPCIDEWLGRKRLCPLCKTSIDVDVASMLADQDHEAEEAGLGAKTRRSGAAAPSAGGGGSRTSAGGPAAASGRGEPLHRGAAASRHSA